MRTLLDTNILLRSGQPSSPHHPFAVASVSAVLNSGRSLCISSQTIYEFLSVATRPLAENGIGMPVPDAAARLSILLKDIDVLYDSPAVSAQLLQLVVDHDVKGKRVHDARLAATMSVNGIPELLTF